jgi:hypothetical protein
MAIDRRRRSLDVLAEWVERAVESSRVVCVRKPVSVSLRRRGGHRVDPSIMLTLQKGGRVQQIYFEDGETVYWKHAKYFEEHNLATDRSVEGLIATVSEDFRHV